VIEQRDLRAAAEVLGADPRAMALSPGAAGVFVDDPVPEQQL
jgi:hypothetical protein